MAQTVVRCIDSEVINLFNLAAVSSVSGDNGTGGGASGLYAKQTQDAISRGRVTASISGAADAARQVRTLDAPNAFRETDAPMSIPVGSSASQTAAPKNEKNPAGRRDFFGSAVSAV